MGLILWIDHNTFATSLIEKVFKKKLLPFYTLNNVDDFAYLVNDLNPVLIVLDGETLEKNPEAFKSQYQASPKMQSLPFLLLEPKGDMSFIQNQIGELKRPFDPFELPQIISKLMTSN